MVSFLGMFTGFIDSVNLSRPTQVNLIERAYPIGSIVQARIIFIDHGSKEIRLSIRPHVIEFRSPKNIPPLGAVLSDLLVVQSNKKIGVLLADSLGDPNSDTSEDCRFTGDAKTQKGEQAEAASARERRRKDELITAAFIHKSSLVDRESHYKGDIKNVNQEDVEKQYRVGRGVCCRVVGHHLVEGYSLATTMSPFDEDKQAITHSSQVFANQILDVKILSLNNFGLVLQIGEKLQGICPAIHASDSATGLNLQKRFKVGQKLRMKVWEINGHKILLTNKKSLIECDDSSCIIQPSDATKGLATLGVISKISELGIQVHFFNMIKGLIPMSVLVKQGVTDPEDAFRVGQIVRCVVLSLTYPNEYKGKQPRRAKPRILLSLDLGAQDNLLIDQDIKEIPSSSKRVDEDNLSSSVSYVSGSIIKTSVDHINVRLDDGRAAVLERFQLCDSSNFTEVAIKAGKFQVGKRIESAVVLSDGKGGVKLSVKPLFLSVAATMTQSSSSSSGSSNSSKMSVSDSMESEDIYIPTSFQELLPGQLVAGYVFKVESYGVLVRFGGDLVALAPRPNIADRFTATATGLFEVGDSVRCVIQRVDHYNKRIVITLKSALVSRSGGSHSYLASYLKESYFFGFNYQDSKVDWQQNSIGSVVIATITAIKEYGVILLASDKTTVMLAHGNFNSSSSIEIGKEVKAVVLDVNFVQKVLDVSVEKNLVSSIEKLRPDMERNLESSKLEGTILLVKNKYLVVSTSFGIGYVMIADFHCPYMDPRKNEVYQVDKKITVQVSGETANGDFPHSRLLIYSVNDDNGVVNRKETARLQREADDADSKLHSMHTTKSTSLKRSSTVNGEVDVNSLRQNFLDGLRLGGKHCWIVDQVHPDKLSLFPEHSEVLKLKINAYAHVSCAIESADAFDDLEKQMEENLSYDSRKRISKLHPFFNIKRGFKVWCKIMQVRRKVELEMSDGVDPPAPDDNENIADRFGEIGNERISIEVQLALLQKDSKSTSYIPRPMVQWRGKNAVEKGGVYAGVVVDLRQASCSVALSPYVTTTLNYLDVSNEIEIVNTFRQKCFLGQRIVVAVIADPKSRGRRSFPVSRALIENLVSGASEVNLSNVTPISLDGLPTVEVGQTVDGLVEVKDPMKFINRPLAFPVFFKNGVVGTLCACEAADVSDWKDLSYISDKDVSAKKVPSYLTKNGGFLKFVVTKKDENTVNVSLRPSRIHKAGNGQRKLGEKFDEEGLQDLPEEGSLVKGYVISTNNDGCFVRLSFNVIGRALIKDLSDEFVDIPSIAYSTGKLVTCRVLSVNSVNNSVALSMKESLVGKKLFKELSKLSVGQIVEGHVKSVAPFGIFVNISKTNITGLSRKENAVNQNVEDLNGVFEVGDLVKARILSITGHKVSLGLKGSYFSGDASDSEIEIDKPESEDKSEVEDESNACGHDDNGMFVDSVSEESDQECSNDDESNEDGKLYNSHMVKVVDDIQDTDHDDNEAEVEGYALFEKMKREYGFDDEDLESRQDHSYSNSDEDIDYDDEDDGVDEYDGDVGDNEDDEYVDNEVQKGDEEEKYDFNLVNKKQKKTGSVQELGNNDSFIWDDFRIPATSKTNDGDNSDDGTDDDDDDFRDDGSDRCDEDGSIDQDIGSTDKKKRRKKQLEKKQQEDDIRQKENAIQGGTSVPESPADFERMLVGEPNSSYLWIQYMVHHLMSVNIDSARKVAERALRTIGFREDAEKYNIWVAYVNLEHKYGDDSSLDTVFKRAVNESRGKYLHINLAEVYRGADDLKNAELVFEKALKKYKKSKKVWIAYQHYRLQINDPAGAKALLGRSMQSLSKHKHIEVITKYAIAEFEFGSAERGRVIFEDMLTNFPKRTDLWHIYVDQEVKYKNIRHARGVFERMTTIKSSTKNMKAAFKKFITFEAKYGDKISQEECKKKMRMYVESFS